eukprot:TRINITY_DN32445_c0_g1_i1.p1 TRINITY_DN32445_c0_g1~~TRINITY_DN32445_c0_g1_i1.p1  ORF type:complete len:332 (+),score=69.49 TRINITY_DN32445_c0_g1_i1:68-1063(+)
MSSQEAFAYVCPDPSGAGSPSAYAAAAARQQKPPAETESGVRARVVVFDFDLTLTTIHLFHTLVSGLMVRGRDNGMEEQLKLFREQSKGKGRCPNVWGGEGRLALLTSVLRKLQRDAELRVLSHGYTNVVRECLECAGLTDFFTTISGVDSEELSAHNGYKCAALAALTRERGLQTRDVVFVDDDSSNLVPAVREGFRVFWPSQQKGLDRLDMLRLVAVCEGQSTPSAFSVVGPVLPGHPYLRSGLLSLFGEEATSLDDAQRRLKYKPDGCPQRVNGIAIAVLPDGRYWLLEAAMNSDCVRRESSRGRETRTSRGSTVFSDGENRRTCLIL